MLSKVLGFFTKRGKQLAGSDKAGNAYYRQLQNNEGRVSERRWVEFGGSSKEMEELEARRRAIKVKADLLDKEEEKRRFRAKALQQGMNEDDVGPQGMTRFLQQVTGSDTSAQQSDSGAQQQAPETKPIFKPNTWNPSVSSTESGEAAGSGDKFKPGTWKP